MAENCQIGTDTIKSDEKPHKRLPAWLKKPLSRPSELHRMKKVLRERNLHTVCESARCPNIGECFTRPTATFLILGDKCTRGCGFCSVKEGVAPKPDANEPANIALTAKELGLKHIVITSVTRDDLGDGGAAHFASVISALKDSDCEILVEVLTPDFLGIESSYSLVFDASPDIFNHNLETVSSLYETVRPGADYKRSLNLLRAAASAGLVTKSGIMVGFGEKPEEVKELLRDIKEAGVKIVTIGQYLRPTAKSLPVVDYIEEEVFKDYEDYAKGIGIKEVFSGALVRSSYNADKVWKNFIG